MPINILFLLAGLVALYYGSEWLVKGSSRVALRYNVPSLIIGLTIVAVGTSAPELFVSVQAAILGQEGLSLGNIIGSNIANIGLILGVSGTISVVAVKQTLIRREIPILIVVTFFATVLTLDGSVNQLDGILLLVGFTSFNYFFYVVATTSDEELDIEVPDEEEVESNKSSVRVDIAYIVAGSILLVIGSRLMVIGATAIAEAIGVSDLVIGVTVVAFGTSLPELATSINAVFKKEDDIAIGNVIGSNVANLLLVLGATSSIRSIHIDGTDLSIVEYVVMISFTLLLVPFVRDNKLSRVESAVFLGAYLTFIGYSFFTAVG